MKLLKKIKYKLKYYFSSIPQPEKWVFIAGCSNSGTSLLHNLLAQHSSIGSLPDEGQFCTNQLPLNRNIGVKRLWAVPPEKMYLTEKGDPSIDIVKLKKQWAVRFNKVNKPVLLEKSPPNTVRLRWLQANFPNAYFIGIHRNGYAVAEGIRRKAGHPVTMGAQQWNNANRILLEDFNLLQHKMLVSYEKLTEDPETTIKEICRFIGIAPLAGEIHNQYFEIHGTNRKISNLNELSLLNLSEEDLILIEREAGEMLKKLDYIQAKHS